MLSASRNTAVHPGLVLLLMWLNMPPIFGLSSPSLFEKLRNGMFVLVIFCCCCSCTNFSLMLQKGRLKKQTLNFNIIIQHSMLRAQLLAACVCSVCFVCRLGKKAQLVPHFQIFLFCHTHYTDHLHFLYGLI